MFPRHYFDFTLCVWNTLGNVKNEIRVLRELAQVTSGSIFITVYYKGTLEERKHWYRTVGVRIKKVDEKNEIFYSASGLRSKSYSTADIRRLAASSHLRIQDLRMLNKVMLWAELCAP